MADQGADANFISASFLEETKKHLTSLQVKELIPSLIYRNVTGDLCIPWVQSVFLDAFLQIWREINFTLRNINWKTTNEKLTKPSKRHIVLNPSSVTTEVLSAAHNKTGDDIDVSEKLNQDGKEKEHESVVTALCGGSVFYSVVQAEDDGLRNEDICFDLGNDSI